MPCHVFAEFCHVKTQQNMVVSNIMIKLNNQLKNDTIMSSFLFQHTEANFAGHTSMLTCALPPLTTDFQKLL